MILNYSNICQFSNIPNNPPCLDKDEIHIWHIPLGNNEFSKNLSKVLRPEEVERSEKFINLKSRNQYCMSRYALRILLSRYTNSDPRNILFGHNSYQKPYLAYRNLPIKFNLSHSESVALCAFTLETEVGIDIEAVKPLQDILSLAEIILSHKEMKYFLKVDKEKQKSFFYRAWTRKEAFLKAQGKGFFHPIKEIEISTISQIDQTGLHLPNENGQVCIWTFQDFTMTHAEMKYQGSLFWEGGKKAVYHFLFKF